eukprot:COSAG06_NODE_3422_length_5370_cov_2.834187_3_plen_670_part_00
MWVTGLGSKQPPLSMLTAHKTNSAVDHDSHGLVSTDDWVLNKIYHAATMSTSDVLQSIGMDVPDRERLGWLGDTSQYSEAAMRMFDATAFFENQLRNEVDQAALYGGWVGDICPGPFPNGPGDPAWQSALVGIAQHLYQETGDDTVIRRTFEAVKKQVELYLEDVNATKKPSVPSAYRGFDFRGLLTSRGFGDYLNLACTCNIYGDSTKMGIIQQSNISCDYIVSDNHYLLRAIAGLVEMSAVVGENRTHSTMEAVYAKTQAAFAGTFAGPEGNSTLALSQSGHQAAPLPVLASRNQTQSLLSLVLTAGPGMTQSTQQNLMVALLNDLMSMDQNCVLSGGGNPAGNNYGCFRQRAHFTGGMVGFKATVEALQQFERIDELYETLANTDWPGFGFMVANNATVLWESWGVILPLNKGVALIDDACISAGWLGSIAKYFFTQFSGISQSVDSVGYIHPKIKPLVPMRMGGLDAVQAHLRVPAGTLLSSWVRHNPTHIQTNFSVPVGSFSATLGVPTLNISRPIVTVGGTVVFESGRTTEAAGTHGLVSAHYTAAGSSVALEFTTSGSGTWAFQVTGSAPTTIGPTSANIGAELSLHCPLGSGRILNIPKATYGADGCSSGGAQFLLEKLCMLKATCTIPVLDSVFDPAKQICRGVAAVRRVLEVVVECGQA